MKHLIAWFEAKRGRRIALASHLDIAPSAVSRWGQVPSHHVLAVEAFTGISRHDLRPDVFGASPSVSNDDAETGACPTNSSPATEQMVPPAAPGSLGGAR